MTRDMRRLIRTGVGGLDEVLAGGLERDRIYLIEGTPGSGKTTLGLQFLMEGVRAGETSLYITLSETETELRKAALSHGWSLEGVKIIELAPLEADSDLQQGLVHPSELELGQTMAQLLQYVKDIRPRRLVIDALTEIRLLAEDPFGYRRQVLALKRFFAKCDCTVLALDDLTEVVPGLQLHSVVHGVVSLEQRRMEYGVVRRRMSVVKLRGADYRSGYHDYVIRTGGLTVFPSLTASEHSRDYEFAPLSSGIAQLDSLLGGGLRHGTSTLLIGPSGAGKSTLAIVYALAAARNTRSAIFALDESFRTACERTESLGMDLSGARANGSLAWIDLSPTTLSPGEFIHRVQEQVAAGAELVVIDSLNSYIASMPEEKALLLQMHELLTYLGNRGVVTILIMAQHGLVGDMQAPLDLSFMADSIVMLRYFEAEGQVRKAISVLKSRSGLHETAIREYTFLLGRGIAVGEPLRDFMGVLTGVPRFVGESTKLSGRGDEKALGS